MAKNAQNTVIEKHSQRNVHFEASEIFNSTRIDGQRNLKISGPMI